MRTVYQWVGQRMKKEALKQQVMPVLTRKWPRVRNIYPPTDRLTDVKETERKMNSFSSEAQNEIPITVSTKMQDKSSWRCKRCPGHVNKIPSTFSFFLRPYPVTARMWLSRGNQSAVSHVLNSITSQEIKKSLSLSLEIGDRSEEPSKKFFLWSHLVMRKSNFLPAWFACFESAGYVVRQERDSKPWYIVCCNRNKKRPGLIRELRCMMR